MIKILRVITITCLIFIFYKAIEADVLVLKGDKKIEEFKDIELGFFPEEFDGIRGVILNANPSDGCSPIAKPPNLDTHKNWFVLISGNYCDYRTKVIYANLAGYSAAVIYSLVGDSSSIHRIDSDYYTNISAVAIQIKAGLIIRKKYLYTIDERFSIVIYINENFDSISFLSMVVAGLAGLIVLIMLSFLIIKFVQRSSTEHNSRLSTDHLEQLPTSLFKSGDPYETCAICLEDFRSNDKLRILPCCHGYHMNCIDQWLTQNRRICPICKKQVVFQGESPENDEEFDSNRFESAPLLGRTNPIFVNNYRTVSNDFYPEQLPNSLLNSEQVTENIAIDVENSETRLNNQVFSD